MIIEEIKNIRTDSSGLRKFGITVGVVLGILAGIFFLRQKDGYIYFIILSVGVLTLALIWPKLLGPIYKVWMTIALIIGTLVTNLILIILFYLIVTPIGVLVRLFNRKLLNLEFRSNQESYWIETKATKSEKSRYEKQF